MTTNQIFGSADGLTVIGNTVEELIEQTVKIAQIVGRRIKLDVQLGKEIYLVRPDGTVQRDRSREHSFEVGGIYTHEFYPSKKKIKFRCTERVGDHIVLKEVGGKRIFEGEVSKASTYGGFNECLKVGVIDMPDYKLVDSIVAHDYLAEGAE